MPVTASYSSNRFYYSQYAANFRGENSISRDYKCTLAFNNY